MRIRMVSAVFVLCFLAGCTVANVTLPVTAVPTGRPLPTAARPVALPETSTPAAAETSLPQVLPSPVFEPTETAVLSSLLPPSATAATTDTPTFAAYGLSQTIGTTVQGRPITAYRFGYGADKLIFIGGMHGGYEWNSIAIAYEAIDYFSEHPEAIPRNVTLYIIPSVNVDGQYLITGSDGRFDSEAQYFNTSPGRFNANGVDLNRNWDCEWSALAQWQDEEVSGGETPFSEPESQALRRFFIRERPKLVLFWHSKAGGVYAAGCPGTFAPSLEMATVFGEAAGYPVFENFTAYPVTGDAGNWLALLSIPSFTVELKTHTGLDWPQNLAGMTAILAEYGR